MLVLSRIIGLPMAVFDHSILWSLVCEEVYYLLYPVLLIAFRSIGLKPLIAGSFVAAYALVILMPDASGDYAVYGPALNWVVGFPCWLLGCLLGERIDQPAMSPTPRRLWLTRAATVGVAMCASILRFHTPAKYPWTLDLFAIACFFWLQTEILYYRTRPERTPHLERLGLGSYSIYLVHVHAWLIARLLGLDQWFVPRLLFVFAFAYLFYRFVEAPSHRLARRSYRWILARETPGLGGEVPIQSESAQ
jgi:peptidoglycan/LPS O-acetylase OafA/YrhL